METTKYRRWQVILGVIGFLMLMSIAGKSDMDSKQIVLDERVNMRDAIKKVVDQEENIWTAYYIQRSR